MTRSRLKSVGCCGRSELAPVKSVLLSLSAVLIAIQIGPREMTANSARIAYPNQLENLNRELDPPSPSLRRDRLRMDAKFGGWFGGRVSDWVLMASLALVKTANGH